MKTKLKSKVRIYILILLINFGVSMFFSGIPKVNYSESNEMRDTGLNASEAPFKVGLIAGPSDLDPHYAYDSISLKVIDQVCETLYQFNISDPSCSIIPHLAAAFPTFSPDGLSLTIPLETEVTFHDGSKFNASSVEWNLYRLMHFLNWSGNSWLPEPWNVALDANVPVTQLSNLFKTSIGEPIIDHIETPDEYTVKIVLREVKGSFLSLLCHHTYMGAYMVSTESTPLHSYIDTNTGDLVGTGPFIYDGYELDQEVNFTKYEDYWDKVHIADIEKMIFKIYLNQAELNDALLEGSIHFIDSVLDSMIDTFRTHPDITVIEEETVVSNHMGFNGEMVNTTFRKAISYAINYSYLIDEILLGKASRLKSPIPRGISMSNYGFNYPVFDRAYAQSIMQSMGFGDDFITDEEWLAVADSGGWPGTQHWNITAQTEGTFRRDLALSISDNLRYLGIDAPVVQIPFNSLINCIISDKRQIPMYMLGWAPDYPDPENYITPLYSSRSTFSVNTYDEELEELMLEGETTGDYFARQPIYDEIQRKLVEELYFFAWISVGKRYYAMSKYLTGFIANPLNIQSFYLCQWEIPPEDPIGDILNEILDSFYDLEILINNNVEGPRKNICKTMLFSASILVNNLIDLHSNNEPIPVNSLRFLKILINIIERIARDTEVSLACSEILDLINELEGLI
ncbi:MAG: ABC transporter substrate-binding protein [Promethearchaeota archaeon]